MLDRIITFGFFVALWIWNWRTMQDVVRHEKAILELRARLALRPEQEEHRYQICNDQSTCPAAEYSDEILEEDLHKLECSTCQIFLDEDCETYYDCSACYECAELGGVWEPRYEEETES